MELPRDDNLIIGLSCPDDAGVYRISDDLALIQTVDFFTPIVDDPFDFGRIAVANALSDVYAMGGKPKTALNLVAFPAGSMEISVLHSILEGGISKMREAGVVLVGGHTVKDQELKYGIAVTGFVHPGRFYSKHGFVPGDMIVLTKPIGTGVISTALKGGVVDSTAVEAMTESMLRLNKEAMEAAEGLTVHACTDVTGFGLLGHLAEMIEGLEVGARIWFSRIPLLPGAGEAAEMGLVPGGTRANMDFRKEMIIRGEGVDDVMMDLLFDPQTSGGLLLGMPEKEVDSYMKAFSGLGGKAWVIGEVTRENKGKIRVLA